MFVKTLKNVLTALALLGSLFILLAYPARAQTPNQVNDPSNPLPDYVKRAAEHRPSPPSFQDIQRNAQLGAVWPGDRRNIGLNSEDRKRLKTLMTPDPADLETYREFLKQDETGIFRLYPDFDCVSKRTISVAGDCAYQVDNGSKHSFRGSNYFPDVQFNNGRLVGVGFFSLEIMVNLGEVPVESLTLESEGVGFLDSFEPASTFAGANEQFHSVMRGITSSGMRFSRSVVPQLNHSYAMRIIAFNNRDPLTDQLLRRKPDPIVWQFRSLQMDKRTDVIIAFRIVRLEQDGNITVLWKRLRSKKAPVISFGKNERLRSFL